MFGMKRNTRCRTDYATEEARRLGRKPECIESVAFIIREVRSLAIFWRENRSLFPDDEQFFVYDGKVSIAVPVVFTRNVGDQTLQVEVRFQACSADQCQRPSALRLDLPVRAEKHVEWHS